MSQIHLNNEDVFNLISLFTFTNVLFHLNSNNLYSRNQNHQPFYQKLQHTTVSIENISKIFLFYLLPKQIKNAMSPRDFKKCLLIFLRFLYFYSVPEYCSVHCLVAEAVHMTIVLSWVVFLVKVWSYL